MEKQKLAELVMQKMKEKKELEERNRPHFEVLRLEATFQKEIYDDLKNQLTFLEEQLSKEKNTLKKLQDHLQQLDNTGKRNYPRIIVMPDFIASEHIAPNIKQFYRKSSNSFLRTDIIRNKAYHESVQRQKAFLAKIEELSHLEQEQAQKKETERNALNQKRTKVLKEDLRLRAIREEQRQIRQTIERQKDQNKDLLKEYEVKKLNLENRKDHLQYVEEQIEIYKRKIENAFNPTTYREHLQNIFNIEIKNEAMVKHLQEVTYNVAFLEKQTEKYQRRLEKTSSLLVLGRTRDSPSVKKGKIQKRLQSERDSRLSQTHRRSSSVMTRGRSENNQRALSQQSIKQSPMDLDFSKIGSTAKHSQKTTDRSTHPRYRSQLTKQLF